MLENIQTKWIIAFFVLFVWLLLWSSPKSSPPTDPKTSPATSSSLRPQTSTVSISPDWPPDIPKGSHIPSRIASSTTDDRKAIDEFHIAGVWGIIHPRDTAAEFVWLHHDGRLTLRRADCGIYAEGNWQYNNTPFLEFVDQDESRSSMMVTRVPKGTMTMGDYIILDSGQHAWMFLGRETKDGCS